jgi:hypothetical protein
MGWMQKKEKKMALSANKKAFKTEKELKKLLKKLSMNVGDAFKTAWKWAG